MTRWAECSAHHFAARLSGAGVHEFVVSLTGERAVVVEDQVDCPLEIEANDEHPKRLDRFLAARRASTPSAPVAISRPSRAGIARRAQLHDAEAVSILGASVGLAKARYIQVSYEEARAGMISAGVSPSLADAVMQTARGFNEGRTWAREARSPRNTTETTLETFAAETFAPAYRAAVEKSGR